MNTKADTIRFMQSLPHFASKSQLGERLLHLVIPSLKLGAIAYLQGKLAAWRRSVAQRPSQSHTESIHWRSHYTWNRALTLLTWQTSRRATTGPDGEQDERIPMHQRKHRRAALPASTIVPRADWTEAIPQGLLANLEGRIELLSRWKLWWTKSPLIS